MKLYRHISPIVLIIFTVFSCQLLKADPTLAKKKDSGYEITFNVKNLNDSIVYLARYLGDNKYIKDTILVEGKEKFTIKGDEPLDCGIYLIVREKRNSYFEFLVYEQKFTMTTDTTDFISKTTFKNSPNNTLLYDYFKFTNEQGKLLSDTSLSKEEKQAIALKIRDYKRNFVKENPENPMSVVFQVLEDVEIPDSIKNIEGEAGQIAQYNYYLNHYWDKVDFSSNCLLRTPVFHGKLQRYFDNVVPQHYDSIPKYADMVVEKARVNDELFKYIVNYLTFKWESGKEKRMCWDKVFYHMARTYYTSIPSQTPWVEPGRMAKIEQRVKDLKYNLCSEPAVPFQMKYENYNFPPGLPDTNRFYHDFNKMAADYVILWFWDSDCGHCKKQTPVLWEVYQKYKKEGKSVEVLAINIEQESKGYLKYLREHEYTWINVQDTAHLTKFRDYYDIYSTPVSFVLDKERKIIAKRIDPKGIENFLDQVFENEEKKKLEAKREE